MVVLFVLLTAGCLTLKQVNSQLAQEVWIHIRLRVIDDEVFAIVKAKELKW